MILDCIMFWPWCHLPWVNISQYKAANIIFPYRSVQMISIFSQNSQTGRNFFLSVLWNGSTERIYTDSTVFLDSIVEWGIFASILYSRQLDKDEIVIRNPGVSLMHVGSSFSSCCQSPKSFKFKNISALKSLLGYKVNSCLTVHLRCCPVHSRAILCGLCGESITLAHWLTA